MRASRSIGVLFILLGVGAGQMAEAAAVQIPEIGPHHPVLRLEKSENPQNIMIIYTKTDSSRRFVKTKEQGLPMVDFYWLMSRSWYKPVHPMIKDAARKRFEIRQAEGSSGKPERVAIADSFVVHLKQLKELSLAINESTLFVTSRKKGDQCVVEGSMKLGPSDGDKTVRISSIYTESKKTLLPPFRKMVAVTLNGIDAETGASVKRRYAAAR